LRKVGQNTFAMQLPFLQLPLKVSFSVSIAHTLNE
jgi:hypothetical protein